jgi:hypothetical protein
MLLRQQAKGSVRRRKIYKLGKETAQKLTFAIQSQSRICIIANFHLSDGI